MKDRARSLMSNQFLLAATTVVVLLLKALFNLGIDIDVAQRIVLRVAARFLGQELIAEPVPA